MEVKVWSVWSERSQIIIEYLGDRNKTTVFWKLNLKFSIKYETSKKLKNLYHASCSYNCRARRVLLRPSAYANTKNRIKKQYARGSKVFKWHEEYKAMLLRYEQTRIDQMADDFLSGD